MTRAPNTFSLTWAAAASQSLVIEVTLCPGAEQADISELEQWIGRFVDVGSHGGYADTLLSHLRPDLAIVGRTSDARRLELTLEAGPLDERAFAILGNIVSRFDARVHGVERCIVRSLAPDAAMRVLPALTWETAHIDYPGPPTAVALRVELEEPRDYHKGRRCLVEFGHPAPREHLERLREWMDRWAMLVEIGGFSRPVRGPGEAEAWVDTLQIYDDYSVELVFSLFECAEESWGVLLKLLNRFTVEIAPIELVSIE